MNNFDNKSKIFVCGANGFIGQNLVKVLLGQGRNLNIFKGDILDKKALKQALKQTDVVVDLIGSFNKDIYLLNILSSSNLLEACKESNIKKIIYISSEAVYGEYPGRPYLESDEPKPLTEYGLSKFLAEKIYKFYSDMYNIPIIVLRLSNTYGTEQKKGVVFDFISSILKTQSVAVHNDGKQHRGFLYIDDAVDGIVKSIDYKLTGFEIFNISGRKAYSLLDLISVIKQNIKKEIGVKFVEYKGSDMNINYMFSNYQKAKSFLGYDPKINLKKGIVKTISFISKENNI